MSDLLQMVLDYVGMAESDYALMITGDWGSGKTYFWKHTVLPAVQTKFEERVHSTYVSLYGINSVEMLDARIVAQLHPMLRRLGLAGGAILRAGASVVNLNLEEITKAVGEFSEERLKKRTADDKQLLLCFDDMERVQMPLGAVLGHINQWVEHYGARVVILCNEEEIKRAAADEVARYRMAKEKVVRLTRRFDVPVAELAGTIVDGMAVGADYKVFLKDQRRTIIDLFMKSERPNLRLLKYALSLIERAFITFCESGQDNAERTALIWTLLPVLIEHKLGHITDSEAQQYVVEGGGAVMATLFLDRDSGELSPISKLVSRYGLTGTTTRLLRSSALARLITHGSLDRTELKAELQQRELTPLQVAIGKLRDRWYRLEDTEFAEAFEAAINGVSQGEVRSPQDLMAMFRIAEAAVIGQYVESPLEEIKAAFRTGLTKLEQTGVVISYDKDEILDLFSADRDSDDVKWLAAELTEARNRKREAHRKAEIESLLGVVSNDPRKFAQFLGESRGSGIGDVPLDRMCTPGQFAEAFLGANNDGRYLTSHGMWQRYNESFNVRGLTTDARWLQQLVSELEKSGRHVSQTPSGAAVRRMIRGAHDYAAKLQRLAEGTGRKPDSSGGSSGGGRAG